MTLVLENGLGTRRANAYCPVGFVDDHLATLGRSTQNGWDAIATEAKEAAIIKATTYIDTRFGLRFQGSRLKNFEGVKALAIVIVASEPPVNTTFNIGTTEYTFVTETQPFLQRQILIDSDLPTQAENIRQAVNMDGDYDLSISVDSDVTMNIQPVIAGSQFNSELVTVSDASLTITQSFTGGEDSGSQPLAFPRDWLYDNAGNRVIGIPDKLRQATAEYAVRAVVEELYPSVDGVDITGSIKRTLEKVGPIEEETEYVSGTHLTALIRPYPSADNLIKEYLVGGGKGGTFR